MFSYFYAIVKHKAVQLVECKTSIAAVTSRTKDVSLCSPRSTLSLNELGNVQQPKDADGSAFHKV
eukprot:1275048-Pleurochrysis_carterae.AAC.2